ncbi:hypothetical protein CTheo_822 [Ceratobasidium theobromae]|uniref:Transmembrane protein n=1 Tax=Ceratobasidium theobromae TaxID=1582974 RepID=A0A5N5QW08_9AGAM|nr:hypothetical protein CTheo_822 [Ceratobasidium theobromae]
MVRLAAMSSSTSVRSTKSSTKRSSTRTGTATTSGTSLGASTSGFVTTTATSSWTSSTATVSSDPLTVIQSTTSTSSVTVSTETSAPGGAKKVPVLAISLGVVFGPSFQFNLCVGGVVYRLSLGVLALVGVILLGLVVRRKRAAKRSPYVVKHEPKRRESYPQPALSDSSVYISSKPERDSDVDTIRKSKASDNDLLLSPNSKFRSSRASSSIFVDDNATVHSHHTSSNYIRPLSLGESTTSFAQRGMQLAYGTPQPLSLYEPLSSNGGGRLSPIPGTPITPGIVFAPAEPAHKPETKVLVRRSVRNSIPLTPTISLSPLAPPPLALSSSGPSEPAPQRNRLSVLAPTLYINDSRPQSMVSVYSTQTQNQPMEFSEALSPDVMTTLERLKKRISTPWSVRSEDGYRFGRSEEG